MKRMIGWMLLCLLLCGCEKTAEQPWTEPVFASAAEVWAVEAEETYADAPGELAEHYETLEELTAAAEEIVLVSVLSAREEKAFPVPDVCTAVSVLEAWKGSLRVGERIEILENGGTKNTVLGGIPRMQRDRTYVLFLRRDGDYYRICGAIQGRFVQRGGYLFQQTWESLKLPDCTPMRTGDFRYLVWEPDPEPTCGPYGPPWIMSFESVSDLLLFADAVADRVAFTDWVTDNHAVHSGMMPDYERSATIAAEAMRLPVPVQALDSAWSADLYPETGWRQLELFGQDEGRRWRLEIGMDAETLDPGSYGRPVGTDVYDCSDVLQDPMELQIFCGHVSDRVWTLLLWGFEKEDALTFVQNLTFCALEDLRQ